MTTARIPVTVLTGFLGSGKTTLLNRILSENHGKKIAVIENEFGEVGVDHQLVIGAEEEIFETSNGCICCTVRGDLIRVLNQLLKRRERFDYVLIETTGMADPGPVAQTFFLDDDLKSQFVIDAIVTLVDARHFEQHLSDLEEPAQQVGFADVVLLNKTDLVDPQDLERIEQRIRAINRTARIHRTHNAKVDMDQILGIGAFDLDKAVAHDQSFLEPQYPFEWAGAFTMNKGRVYVRTAGHDHDHGHEAHDDGHDHGAHDHDEHAHDEHAHDEHAHDDHGHGHDHAHADLKFALLPLTEATDAGIAGAIEPAVRVFAEKATPVEIGGHFAPATVPFALEMGCHGGQYAIDVPETGAYALFVEHAPEEFGLGLTVQPSAQRRFASHHHEEEIRSVGLSDARPLNARKVNDWLSYLLEKRGQDIFRMKGVLNIRGDERRYVFHGVHMMFEGKPDRAWGDAPRSSQLVFIGRGLDREELETGFANCFA